MKSYLMILAILLAASAVTLNAEFAVKTKSVDMRPQIEAFGLGVRNQSPRGTCTLFATAFLIEYLTAKEKGRGPNLSEEYLNAMANRATNRSDDGANFPDTLAGYEEFGVVGERQALYKNAFDSTFLMGSDKATLDLIEIGKDNRSLEGDVFVSANAPKQGISDAQINLILTTLESGTPVAIGYSGGPAGVMHLVVLASGEVVVNDYDAKLTNWAHSVPLVGYKIDASVPGGGYVIFRNSGGPVWGDAGYGYMTFKYIKKFTYDGLILKKSPLSSDMLRNKVFMSSRILKRKDVLKKISNQRALITMPYLTSGGLTQLDQRIKGKQ